MNDRGRVVHDARFDITHRSQYQSAPRDGHEFTWCKKALRSTEWAFVPDGVVNCMGCINAGA